MKNPYVDDIRMKKDCIYSLNKEIKKISRRQLRPAAALMLALAMLVSGCGSSSDVITGTENRVQITTGAGQMAEESQTSENGESGSISSESTPADASEIFSDRDFEVGYDESTSAIITLNGDSATCSSDAVQIEGSTITITDEGTYILSGTLNDGMIIINSEKNDKTQLVFDGVVLHSETSAPLYILQADKVFVTMAPDSVNILSNGGSFTAIDENNIDAVIFSKEDITLNGSGLMTINSPGGHGIVSKDSLTITSGTYEINAAAHGLNGKDDVCIANAALNITSGKDGIQADNEEDATKGYIYIESGTFKISAEGDGLSASSTLQIQDGTFDLVTGGGSENAAIQTSEGWGNFMGGGGMGGGRGGMGDPGAGRGGMGGRGGNPGGYPGDDPTGSVNGVSISGIPADPAATTETEDDSTSIKGIKAAADLTINGGIFTIDSADDSIHSNTNLTVNGGTFDIASGDDAFHADDTLTITSGVIDITESYEGLEGLHIVISDGDIALVASDDGLNAAGGTDQSGFGGMRGGDMFGGRGGNPMSGSSEGSILISGGTIDVTSSGDGIDANGTLEITDGYITVCGPTQGDTATLDYDLSATISGGTFIGTGASGMAQTFSSESEQGVIAVSAGNQSAGAQITVTDSSGKQILTYAPELSYNVVIFSSPDVVKGETYSLQVGELAGEIAAD